MKTNKITLMIMGLAVASLFASCKKNDNNAVVGEGFRAFTEQGGNGSRTHGVADGNTIAVQWTSGDQILVANQGGTGSQLTYNLKSGANSTEGSFANTNESSDFLQPDYVAIYPATNAAGVANSISSTTATFNLPATQSYLANSFAEKSMPMVAYSTEQSLQFKNVLGGLCFPIVANGLTVTKIEVISANTSEALWGECTTTISATDDPTSTVSNTDANKNVITLDCGSGITLDATTATDFYVMVPAGTLESGFTVKAYNGDLMIYEKSTSSAPGSNFIPRNTVRKVDGNLTIAASDLTVTTISPTFITSTSAYGAGTVTVNGKDVDPIIERGVCWGTASMPTIDDSHAVADGTVAGTYGVTMSGLVKDQVYYVRAYAKNSANQVVYGDAIPFASRKDYVNDYGGKIPYAYSVDANHQVYFSMGNLQYQASSNTWRFAEYQYEYVGDATYGFVYEGGVKCNNALISQNYTGWIDLFGWGTSGCKLIDETPYFYQPWETTQVVEGEIPVGYYYGPRGNNSLTGIYANGDWGIYNTINNGGNGQWHLMEGHPDYMEQGLNIFNQVVQVIGGEMIPVNVPDGQWYYMLKNRDQQFRFAKAKLVVRNGVEVNGLLVFLDGYSGNSMVSLTNVNEFPASEVNVLTEAQWSLLEKDGTVFLPSAGARFAPDSMQGVNSMGRYWTNTHSSAQEHLSHARALRFNLDVLEANNSSARNTGYSVRLVQD